MPPSRFTCFPHLVLIKNLRSAHWFNSSTTMSGLALVQIVLEIS